MNKPRTKKPPTLADRAWEYRRRTRCDIACRGVGATIERAWTAGYKAALRDSKRSVKR